MPDLGLSLDETERYNELYNAFLQSFESIISRYLPPQSESGIKKLAEMRRSILTQTNIESAQGNTFEHPEFINHKRGTGSLLDRVSAMEEALITLKYCSMEPGEAHDKEENIPPVLQQCRNLLIHYYRTLCGENFLQAGKNADYPERFMNVLENAVIREFNRQFGWDFAEKPYETTTPASIRKKSRPKARGDE